MGDLHWRFHCGGIDNRRSVVRRLPLRCHTDYSLLPQLWGEEVILWQALSLPHTVHQPLRLHNPPLPSTLLLPLPRFRRWHSVCHTVSHQGNEDILHCSPMQVHEGQQLLGGRRRQSINPTHHTSEETRGRRRGEGGRRRRRGPGGGRWRLKGGCVRLEGHVGWRLYRLLLLLKELMPHFDSFVVKIGVDVELVCADAVQRSVDEGSDGVEVHTVDVTFSRGEGGRGGGR